MRESTRRDPFVFLGGTLTTERPGHLAYQPALDGLRAVAVAAVIAYHLGYPWARGGYLGVDTFFVLSGYLITSLLLTEGRAEGRIDLPAFWIRRARRLLPALFLVLAAIAVYAAWSTPDRRAGRSARRRAVRALLLGQLALHRRQQLVLRPVRRAVARSSTPGRSRSRSSSTWCGHSSSRRACTLGRGRRGMLVVVRSESPRVGICRAHGARSPTTRQGRTSAPTHACTLCSSARCSRCSSRDAANVQTSRPVSYAGVLALGAVLIAYATIGDGESFMYRGGFLLFALAVAAVIAAAVHPARPRPQAPLARNPRVDRDDLVRPVPLALAGPAHRGLRTRRHLGSTARPRAGRTDSGARGRVRITWSSYRSGLEPRCAGRVALPSAVAGHRRQSPLPSSSRQRAQRRLRRRSPRPRRASQSQSSHRRSPRPRQRRPRRPCRCASGGLRRCWRHRPQRTNRARRV